MAGTTHEVKPGECIATIAAQYGVPWKTVWEAPENATLRKTRKDPNVLAPGDKVTVPKAKPRQSPIETGKAHRFVIHRERIKIHLRLTANREPLKDEPYRIEFGEREIEGKTSGEGMLEAEVPSDQKDVVLTLPRRQQTYTLVLGEIDPIDTIRGAQTRLYNLGLYRGELDGELGDETTAAIEFFQRIQKLSVTGKYDAATQKALAEFYGF
ncbi:peptidoglycan-binding protein [Polyangium sp. 6x1]|uniref:peptidoglycan-binding protein n=1 Tax=Polyangium sp. 6x1 TaxID=3042689 RepID=UPI002482EFF6|nr:peptidoglycan-binding protein [Polyangium sp. 6x1]MDI1450425.1 peptidoglycan-binding protein [Polyangium sp. 6x1]